MGACQGLIAVQVTDTSQLSSSNAFHKGINDQPQFGDKNRNSVGYDLRMNKILFIQTAKTKFQDDYKISTFLGQGGFGEVRLCVHKLTGNERAVKFIKKDSLTANTSKTFLMEIEILKLMDHPNIIKLFEIYEDAYNFYLVQEVVKGGELFDELVKRKRFQEQDTANIAQSLLSAIEYCHSNNVIHRDLKPENILIDDPKARDIQIKVIDFGASAFSDPTQILNDRLGTVYYIAPEVLKGKYNSKCDVWSIGVILFALLCGEVPFYADSDEQIMRLVEKGKFEFSQKVWSQRSSACKDLIRQLLTFDPEQRLSCKQALNHPWLKQKVHLELSNKDLNLTVSNLRQFTAKSRLKQAAMIFIVFQLSSAEDQESLVRSFKAFDTNGNGTISRDEVIRGYKKLYGDRLSKADIDHEVDLIWTKLDLDGSGTIDYTEWAVGTISKTKVLTKPKLKSAFDLFDIDHNGKISAQEIQKIMGNLTKNSKSNEKFWIDMIKEDDEDGDGEISYHEFEKLMNLFIQEQYDNKVKNGRSIIKK